MVIGPKGGIVSFFEKYQAPAEYDMLDLINLVKSQHPRLNAYRLAKDVLVYFGQPKLPESIFEAVSKRGRTVSLIPDTYYVFYAIGEDDSRAFPGHLADASLPEGIVTQIYVAVCVNEEAVTPQQYALVDFGSTNLSKLKDYATEVFRKHNETRAGASLSEIYKEHLHYGLRRE